MFKLLFEVVTWIVVRALVIFNIRLRTHFYDSCTDLLYMVRVADDYREIKTK